MYVWGQGDEGVYSKLSRKEKNETKRGQADDKQMPEPCPCSLPPGARLAGGMPRSSYTKSKLVAFVRSRNKYPQQMEHFPGGMNWRHNG